MNRLTSELRIIRPAGWIVAAVVYCGLASLMALTVARGHAEWWLSFLLVCIAPLFPATYALLVSYIYADARRRGMRYVVWTLLAIFIPNAVGVLLYILLRDAPPSQCPACYAPIRAGFTHCPQCGAGLGRACGQCQRPVEASWNNCAYCGEKLR
jgi:Double zinc ribbon